MAHKRSPASRFRRRLRWLMLQHTYRDRKKAETVCTTSFDIPITHCDKLGCTPASHKAGCHPITFYEKVCQGEVLADAYGRGSLQQT